VSIDLFVTWLPEIKPVCKATIISYQSLMKPEDQSVPSEIFKSEQQRNFLRKKIIVSEPVWDSLKAGDNASFEQIFKQYYRALLNYGMRLNHDEDEIKDCIQILFLTIWERKESLGDSDSVKNYLLASLRRLVIKRMNAAKNTFVSIDDSDIAFHADLSVEAQMIRDQNCCDNINALQTAISKLPHRQKEALFLRFYSDQSFADIAAVMDISTRAVYKLIYKALEALNEDLAPYSKSISFLLFLFFSLPFDPVLDFLK